MRAVAWLQPSLILSGLLCCYWMPPGQQIAIGWNDVMCAGWVAIAVAPVCAALLCYLIWGQR